MSNRFASAQKPLATTSSMKSHTSTHCGPIFYTSADQVKKFKYLSNRIIFSSLYDLIKHPLGEWMDKLDDAYYVHLHCTTIRTGCRSSSPVLLHALRFAGTTRVLHIALWARLRAVLTKSADEWTGKFVKFKKFEGYRNFFFTVNLTNAILVQNCHAAVSVGLKSKETQEEC